MVKQKFGCIYRLTNTKNGRKYIGKTIQFRQRMYQHKSAQSKAYLGNAIRKYGWKKFKQEILIDNVPEEDLNNLEISYIEVENTMAPHGYNLTKGGEGVSGMKQSAARIEKHRKFMIERNSKRKQFGSVSYRKKRKKWVVQSASPDCNLIGCYDTEGKARKALKLYNKTGKRMESDRSRRKKGTGCVRYDRGKYVASIERNKKRYSRCFETKGKAEAFLNDFIKHFDSNGTIMKLSNTRRKKGTGTIRRNSVGRYQASIIKNKLYKSKTFDTVEECEAWMKSIKA